MDLHSQEAQPPPEHQAQPVRAQPLPPPPRPRSIPPKTSRPGCGTWILVATTIGFALLSFILLIMVGVLASSVGAGLGAVPAGGKHNFIEGTISGDPGSNRKVLIVPIQGIIMDASRSGMMRSSPGMVSTIISMLDAARMDANIEAVILRIDSPGGGITASDILYHEIASFREETGIPVLALFDGVAASGGYYVAAAAERIISHPTTMTGSIGVVLQLLGVEGLLQKVGIESRTIKSGDFKDIGSSYRPMQEEERKMLQAIIDEYHGIFVTVVQKGFKLRGKNITRKQLEKLCDGRVFTGRQAMKLGFVDAIGYFDDAVSAAAKKAGIPLADVHVVTYMRRPGLIEALLTNAATPRPQSVKVEIAGMPKIDSPRFMYLWTVPNAEALSSQ